MTGFGTDEPYQNFVEVVDIGTWFNSTPDVRLTYTPSSRGQYISQISFAMRDFQHN